MALTVFFLYLPLLGGPLPDVEALRKLCVDGEWILELELSLVAALGDSRRLCCPEEKATDGPGLAEELLDVCAR